MRLISKPIGNYTRTHAPLPTCYCDLRHEGHEWSETYLTTTIDAGHLTAYVYMCDCECGLQAVRFFEWACGCGAAPEWDYCDYIQCTDTRFALDNFNGGSGWSDGDLEQGRQDGIDGR